MFKVRSNGSLRPIRFYAVERRIGYDMRWVPVGIFFGEDLDYVIETAARYLADKIQVKIALLRATEIEYQVKKALPVTSA